MITLGNIGKSGFSMLKNLFLDFLEKTGDKFIQRVI